MSDFRRIRAAQTARLRSAHHRVTATASLADAPFNLHLAHNAYPILFSCSPPPLARALVHDAAYLPHGRMPLSTARRITTLNRTGTQHLHEAAALRSESFWSVVKTNAGESQLQNLSGVLAALRELVRARTKRSGRLTTPPPPPLSQSCRSGNYCKL